jgi:hypothetical protein
MQHVGRTGAIVRLYGFPGTFRIIRPYTTGYDWLVSRDGAPEHSSFPTCDASIVEIDGAPVPLRSAPLSPPAPDYPHTPTFNFNDGPQSLATHTISLWQPIPRQNQ